MPTPDRTFEIHPRIGVARLGNSPDFYLAPDTEGGLPIQCDQGTGDAVTDSDTGLPAHVTAFKDVIGRVLRQAAVFRVFETTGGSPEPIDASTDGVSYIEWTVHVASKKPVWYTFSELQGDLNFGEANSYANQHIPVNNPDTTDAAARQALIIDPGPRTVTSSDEDAREFSRYPEVDPDYPKKSFPPVGSGGQQIDTLGSIRTDSKGNLVALGGFGNVTGDGDITSFRGAAGYWDDIADGFVTATVYFDDDGGSTYDVDPAWLLVGSPKFAPELVNITTLYDTQYDVAVRKMGLDPELFDADAYTDPISWSTGGYSPLTGYNPNYTVDFDTQVKPIFDRINGYRWVADVPYLADFFNPFPLGDNEAHKAKRERLFRLFRVPLLPEDYADWAGRVGNGPETLFSEDGLPLLPLNSGDNSVSNTGPVYKFETLSPTQYFFLHQWAEGNFAPSNLHQDVNHTVSLADQMDRAHAGNCVGAPFSPGIETTWIVRNAAVYADPFQVRLAHLDADGGLAAYYQANGLSTTADEGDPASGGCEPGDLTKRMAIPWQADFQECTVQTPNITTFDINQFADGTGIEVPPAYYVYWWPPQSPMHVMTGSLEPQDQVLDAIVSQIAGQPIIPAGQRVPYQRGILNVTDMISSWSRLGFIVNRGAEDYPYFVETERDFGALGQLAALQQAQRIASVQNK